MKKKEKLTKFHRDNILSAANSLFQEKGVERTTVDMICKRAEYSKAT
ncbi:MAG: TetR/AcrR family transcriptional regulator [Clostridiales Family XIII bacterium]|jgi:AcrR family transcriptional regulator|nr:TetR/AcrR family transcriptional regulator [Clostridiales Family XIII bacterium]